MIRKDQEALGQLLQLGLVVVVSVAGQRLQVGRGTALQPPYPPSSPELPGQPGVRPAEAAHECHHRAGCGLAAGPGHHDHRPPVYAEEVRLGVSSSLLALLGAG